MILIGDVHATKRLSHLFFDKIKKYVLQHQTQDVIFMGDIVYHFSYNRDIIVQFFQLLRTLGRSGYNVHVLAGNHDRIANHYIYHELASLQSNESIENNELPNFYASPTVVSIEGKPTLMLPRSPALPNPPGYVGQKDVSEENAESRSIAANNWLKDFLGQYPKEEVQCFHHYYTADTIFPGMKGRFTKKDSAIDKMRLNEKRLRLFSGHIHHGFLYENYLCTGAIRQVGNLEVNRVPAFVHVDNNQLTLTPHYYPGRRIGLSSSDGLTQEAVEKHIRSCEEKMLVRYDGGIYKVSKDDDTSIDISEILGYIYCEIYIEKEDAMWQDHLIDEKLRSKLGAVIPKKHVDHGEAVERMRSDHKNLTASINDRQALVSEYIQKKYPNNVDTYLSILKKRGIM